MMVFVSGGRRHLSAMGLLLSLALITECGAGVMVDIPAADHTTNEPTTFQIPSFIPPAGFSPSRILAQGISSIFSVSNLSENCSRDVGRLVGQIMTLVGIPASGNSGSSVENWALQMLDAWGKPVEGLLSGHVNALGDFDECLAIRAPSSTAPKENHFQGKYCLVYTIPNASIPTHAASKLKIGTGERSVENLLKILSVVGNAELPLIPSIGSCMPSTCSDNEILDILRALFATIHLIPVSAHCSVDEAQELGHGAIATISLLIGLASLVLIGTAVELALSYQLLCQTFRKRRVAPLLLAFSLVSNGRKFFNTETSRSDVRCLHGIRFLSASWVVLGHTYLMGVIQPLWNIVDTYSTITTSLSLVVILNAAIVVDVFFVIGGFLVSLTLLTMLEKSQGKLNVPLLYAHRYLRITPLYLLIICVGTFLFPLLGSGPYWHVAKTWAGFCEKNWWKNLLYINNLPTYNTLNDPTDGPCHGMGWYLGVDMQLFLLSPFLLLPVWKWRRFGVIPLAGLTIASIIVPGVLTYLNNYSPTSVPFGNRESKYSQEAYTPTYMRATPYLVGMCTGLLFQSLRQKSFKLSSLQVVGVWLIAIATGFAVLFSPRKFLNPEYDFRAGESAIYVSSQRTAWSLTISWTIFACGMGYGGWINQFLSWRPFVPLGRLTFAIYLVSMHLQFLVHLQYRQPIYFSNLHMINLYFGHLVMSCLVAFLCTMLIEAPFMQLLKLVTESGRGASSDTTNDNNNNNHGGSEQVSKSSWARCSISPDLSQGNTKPVTSLQIPDAQNMASSQTQLINVD